MIALLYETFQFSVLLQVDLDKKIVLSRKAQHLTIYTLRLQGINLKSLLFLHKFILVPVEHTPTDPLPYNLMHNTNVPELRYQV